MDTTTDGQLSGQRAEKEQLRRVLVEQRRNISPSHRCLWDSRIAKELMGLPEYSRAKKLLIYLSTPWEVSTMAPIAHAMGLGKVVAVPRWGGGQMEFCPFTDYRQLVPGAKGILQPGTQAEPLTDFSDSLCVVPALAVDRQGYRLGYGGGYYDRFLSGFQGASVILAYGGLVCDCLPVEPHDLPVGLIVTQNGVIRIEKK